ncbi:MAG: NAD-dependent epimerase/dehydratase family protein [Candidatus Vogelbacteria bacterium]|nr:NAD-dependent epimerase/dehydratase family protein [Candidatus Vogelbacteria bacterium]
MSTEQKQPLKILVTGSSGFLAQHIIPKFQKEGHKVTGVDKRPETAKSNVFLHTDVRDLNYRDVLGVDYIVHLAWRTNIPDCSRHPKESTYDNIDMTVHLLEVAREAGVKKIFFPSTASLYGKNPTPWKEDMLGMPIEHYSWQKLSCEFLLKMYAENFGLNTVTARFFQVFGEYQREDTALAAFLRLKKTGQPITLTETTAQSSFRSGQRDFIYAGDIANAVYILVTDDRAGKGEIYNVGRGKVNTMEEIANAVGGEVKWIPRRPWEVERHEADITKLATLGWSPEVDVVDWIKRQS